MPPLDPNSWSQRDRDDLDNHITGNWEGNYMFNPNDQDPPDVDEPEPRYVYISTGDDSEWLHLWDAVTGEQLSERPEQFIHNLIELANANGWEVVMSPDEPAPDDDPGFDPMFLL